MLALTHLSPRHPAGALRAEAREVFENTIVPRDFDRVDLPLPEKGEPVHVRASEALAADLSLTEPRTTT
jgi:ribonuclease Z